MEKAKKLMVLIAALILATTGVVYAVSQVYWSRQVHIEFNVIGINAEMLTYGAAPWDNYRDKVIATSLDSNNEAVITIFSENFNEIWFNGTYVTNATGCPISIVGQYISLFWDTGSGQGKVNLIGSPFNLNGYHVVDKAEMMYAQVKNSYDSPIGHALLITVTPETAEYAYGGHYGADVLFQMGFV